MQRVLLIGNLGKDPEERTTRDGIKMVAFSLAVSPRKNELVWYDCVIWHNKFSIFEGILKHLKKGSRILLQGELRTPKTYKTKNGDVRIQMTVEPSFMQFNAPVTRPDKIDLDRYKEDQKKTEGYKKYQERKKDTEELVRGCKPKEDSEKNEDPMGGSMSSMEDQDIPF